MWDKSTHCFAGSFCTFGKKFKDMIGAIIGGAVGIGSALIGAANQRRAARQQKRELERQRAAQDAWYKRNYYQDYLNTAQAQNAMKQYRKAWEERTAEARARQAITGGTPEQAQAVAEAGGEAMGNLMGNLAAQGEQNKQAIDAQKMAMDARLSAQESELAAAREAASANLVGNAISVGANALAGIDFGKKAPAVAATQAPAVQASEEKERSMKERANY